MPKFPTFPTLYDECLQVSISFLNKYGYLLTEQWKTGSISWSRNGEQTSRIGITVNTKNGNSYLELDYTCNGKPINYQVQLESNISNLGIGLVWFFICPHIGKRCRKLYLVETYFYHRLAWRGCMYENQTQSHKTRSFNNKFGKAFEVDNIFEEIYGKNFKKQYKGKSTKRFLKHLNKIERVKDISFENLIKH